MKVEFTLKRFPINGRLKEQCGLPFSCVMQPYHRLTEKDAVAGDATGVYAEQIARCTQCYSYINCYCAFDTGGWVCSLCNRHNALKPQMQRRYRLDPAVLQSLPEVRCEVFETLAEEPSLVQLPPDAGAVSGPGPVVVALVDTASGEEFLELVRSSLEAALEALPPVTRFALITFSHRLGLHDVRAAHPSVRYVQMYEPAPRSTPGGAVTSAAAAAASSPAVAAPLSEVLPLASLLAPVGAFKGQITRALEEQMVPEEGFGANHDLSHPGAQAHPPPGAPGQESGMSRGAPGQGGAAGGFGPPPASRGLGPALVAVLDYLKVLQAPPFVAHHGMGSAGATSASVVGADHLSQNQSPVKLLLFTSGVPDFGIGRLINPRRRRAVAAAAAAAAARALAPGGHASAPPHPPTGPALPHPGPSAAPGAGAGADVAVDAEADPDAWLHDVPSSSVEFYEQAAAACASLGVCVDLFAVSQGALGLRFLDPLCSSTGGAVYLYPSVDESAMPQDVYLRLSSPSAAVGIIRLRTSPHFKVVRHYGRLFPDPTIPDLHHIIAADPSDAFAVDFDYATPSGFSGVTTSLPPTLQVAFQYTALVAERGPPEHKGDAEANGGGGAAAAGEGRRYWLQRRLRVATYRVMTAATVADVYAHTNPDAVVTLLMHKILRAAEAQGLQEARLLLRDWLVILALNYHRNVHSNLTPQQLSTVPADLHFSQAPLLAPLPRLVYALLRSPLLAPFAEGQHPDLTAFLRHLWSSLPPHELVRAVYPVMQSYTDPDHLAFPRHSLSRAALAGPDAPPIFLLDAYILIMVYYTSRCPPEVPFPPPQQSALRKAVAAIRSERRITPQVKILREGGEDADLFEQLLLDEPDAGEAGGGGGGGFGLVQFLEHVQGEAAMQMKHELAAAAQG
ncbi:hypothetical protein HYH03_014664 [Edaphochlamys debaryana]|uniref:Uncharacterized protein n=1 Tax=Edaphochlamys debaryana TaxID=47281 RepID=A0A835XMD5_9CHLO|nr:hypothetical protein HYH03_014664 [Edaphochlamys debaryana]|eukprot:KAG2486738.1 hypothetical protein HYH03_014664 [Edaphochlamys debaryana]